MPEHAAVCAHVLSDGRRACTCDDPSGPPLPTPQNAPHVDEGPSEPWQYDRTPESLSEAVQVAGGAFSACWSNLSGAGIFESDRALEVSDALIKWIEANYVPRESRVYVDRAGRSHEL